MKTGIVANMVAFIIVTALTGMVTYLFRAVGFEPIELYRAWGVSLLVSVTILVVFRRYIFQQFLSLALKLTLSGDGEKLGVQKIYKNFDAASSAIQGRFLTAKEVAIFIQLGRGVIGGGKSLLFEQAKIRRSRAGRLRVLYADKEAPHLNRKRAAQRGSVYSEWTSSIEFTEGSLRALGEAGIQVESRRHCEPYLWRLFFFDETLFIVPYVYAQDNSNRAPVLEISSSASGGSLFFTFQTYFENIWNIAEDGEMGAAGKD